MSSGPANAGELRAIDGSVSLNYDVPRVAQA
jgi:hypothetical protein